jgi:hypothetical protein
VGIKHILAAPFHPQTNGKLGRYQQTIKREVNQVPYELPSQLERALTGFVDYYNFRRYHKALGDVTPADVLHGRREQILQRRKEVQARTIQNRRAYNTCVVGAGPQICRKPVLGICWPFPVALVNEQRLLRKGLCQSSHCHPEFHYPP